MARFLLHAVSVVAALMCCVVHGAQQNWSASVWAGIAAIWMISRWIGRSERVVTIRTINAVDPSGDGACLLVKVTVQAPGAKEAT